MVLYARLRYCFLFFYNNIRTRLSYNNNNDKNLNTRRNGKMRLSS